jgi:hypothetical protein
MATITSAQTGDFSDTATWVGGVVPTVGDTAVAANGHVIAIDVDVTVTKVTQLGTGKFTLGGGRTLTAEVEAVSGSFTSGGTVEVTATSGSTAYIIGNVTGVSSTAVNICGVNVTGVGTLDLTGSVTGSAGNASSLANGHAGIYTNATCTIVIDGAITGGAGNIKFGVFAGASSDAAITIVGNINGGGGSASYGVYATGTSAVITATGNAAFGLGLNSHAIYTTGSSASATLTGNAFSAVFQSGAGVRSDGANAAIVVIGNATGGTGGATYGVHSTGTSSTITITGDVTGGTSAAGAYGAFATGASATITITGDVTGGSNTNTYGAHATGASATMTITGNVTGGAGTSAHGAYATGATSLITVTGTATSSSTTSNAIRSDATSSGYGVLFSGDLIDTQSGVVACFARFFRIIDTSPSGVTQYANNASFPTGGTVSRVSADNVTGMPVESDVRDGLTFGYNDELEGTMAVPPSASVVFGVPVDDGVGTAAITPAEVWNYLAASATTPNSLGAILANIAGLIRDDAIEQIITYNRNGNSTLTLDSRTFNINADANVYPIVSFGEEV